MRYRKAIAALAVLSVLTGCSTRPRNFAPQLTAPIADTAAFENDYRTCHALVTQGHTGEFKAAALTAAATGAGTFGATGAAVAVGGVGITGATTAAAVAIPGLGLLAGFGASRAIRSGKERKFKRRMGDCLSEFGYSVGDWTRIPKRTDAAAVALAVAASGQNGAVPAAAAGGTP